MTFEQDKKKEADKFQDEKHKNIIKAFSEGDFNVWKELSKPHQLNFLIFASNNKNGDARKKLLTELTDLQFATLLAQTSLQPTTPIAETAGRSSRIQVTKLDEIFSTLNDRIIDIYFKLTEEKQQKFLNYAAGDLSNQSRMEQINKLLREQEEEQAKLQKASRAGGAATSSYTPGLSAEKSRASHRPVSSGESSSSLWSPEEVKLFGTELLKFLEQIPDLHIHAVRQPGIQCGECGELVALEKYANTQGIHINFYQRGLKRNSSGKNEIRYKEMQDHQGKIISSSSVTATDRKKDIYIISGAGHFVDAVVPRKNPDGTLSFIEKETRGDNNCLFNSYVQAVEATQYPARPDHPGWLGPKSDELYAKALNIRQKVCDELQSSWNSDRVDQQKKLRNSIYSYYYNICQGVLRGENSMEGANIQLAIDKDSNDRYDDAAKQYMLPFKEKLSQLLSVQQRLLASSQAVGPKNFGANPR